ncbi:acyl-CoA thioesterase [Paracoccus aurantiacus]|uniref:Acyl-CoA thioesterase n=1 Tax=Paracoccus aurantiacus TaxID=2599412 RepID=A0A5C6RZB0_9RHOB|nr:thioesterase family protein [Paracoccus aurantiacus]TXB67738.1 acyl-CoA thioesterase [Paracoccus aurantiacus]
MAHFTFPQKILFKHCDPAGIGFYPRYVEIINDAVEALFGDCLRWSFAEIVKVGGVPTARLNIDFKAPCRLGEQIRLDITIDKLGRSSMGLTIVAHGEGVTRFTVDQVIVCIGNDGKPRSWPDAVRKTVSDIMEGTA